MRSLSEMKHPARMCGLSRATAYRLIAQKKLVTIKIGTGSTGWKARL